MKRHVLYRLYDADSQLIYVGRSIGFPTRVRDHSGNRWFERVATITVEHFRSEAACSRAELNAIRTENPALNVHGRTDEPGSTSSAVYTFDEAAELIGIPFPESYDLLDRGLFPLPVFRVDNQRVRVPKAALNRYVLRTAALLGEAS